MLFLTRVHNVIWDEAVYIGMGKWIYSLGTAGIWEMIRPPVLPLLIGLLWKIGLSPVLFGEVLSTLFGIGTLAMVYLIGKRLYDPSTGTLAALFLAGMPLYYQWTTPILTENPATFFLLIGLWLLLEEKYTASGALFGVAALTRFPHALGFAAVVSAVGFLRENKGFEDIKKLVMGFCVPLTPFLIFNYLMYRPETSVWWHAVFRPWILASTHVGNPTEITGTYFTYLFAENIFLVGAILGAFFAVRAKDKKTLPLWMLLLFFAGFYSLIPNKQLRFATSFLPYLCLVAAYGLNTLIDKKYRRGVYALVLIWIAFFSWPAIDTIYQWRFTAEPPLVSEYARFPATLEGPILTADPLPVAYTDALYYPYYYSPNEATALVQPHLTTAQAVIWTDAFYCVDAACREKVEALHTLLSTGRPVLFNGTYLGREYVIYGLLDYRGPVDPMG